MKTIIVYAGKYGTTGKCAGVLQKELKGETLLCDLTKEPSPDISSYDAVIIGGSIYAGSIRKEVSRFCTRYGAELERKKLGLFVCCAASGSSAGKYIGSQYPGPLAAHASVKGTFGGEFLFQRMGFFDRMIIKMITKSRPEGTQDPMINSQNISAFASEWNSLAD